LGMMAAAAQRRAIEPPQPARSAERERLAQAAANCDMLTDRRRRLVLAAEKARGDSAEKAGAVERSERALAAAKREAPRVLALAAIGETASGSSSSLEAAEGELERVQAEHEEAREIAAALKEEIKTTDERLAAAVEDRRQAVREVLDTDPALDLLHAEYIATLAWSAALADVFRLIGPSRLPRRLQYWDSTNPELPPVDEPLPVAQWREALAALEAGEADAPLPAIG